MARLILIVAITSTLLTKVMLSKIYFFDSNSVAKNEVLSSKKSLFPEKAKKVVLSPEQVEQKARRITVKVFSGDTWGSGIIVSKQNNIYTVVTNNHVLIFSRDSSHQIQTVDGQIHEGRIVQQVDFKNKDLGLVQFKSDRQYEVVSLSPVTNLSQEEKVFAGGFPVEMDSQEKINGFYFTDGYVAQFSQLDFGGGYQIGYTNNIKKGMSGGPLLNIKGEVVAINGMHKYPLWGNPYEFSDGSLASESKKQEMSKLSWAIPIDTFLKLAPQFSSSN